VKTFVVPVRRLLLASAVALGGLWAAGAASAHTELDWRWQDRDVARMVSLGGSCNRCELSGRNLSGATFTGATFLNATMVGTNLRGAELVGSNFSHSDFSRADLRGVEIVGATFANANFTGAALQGAEAMGALRAERDESPDREVAAPRVVRRRDAPREVFAAIVYPASPPPSGGTNDELGS
jgi:hypothetical protein